MDLNEWAKRGSNYRGNRDEMEYFEDTRRGNDYGGAMPQYSQTSTMQQQQAVLSAMRFAQTPNYQNLVVYEPRTPEDVQLLIDYLKQREPAVVNLNNIEPNAAQRILDFVSGAIYALSGSVHRVEPSGNIFLLSPEGVGITVPYESK